MLRRSDNELEHCDEIYTLHSNEDLIKFLGKTDYIINVLPHTSDTAGLLSGDVLRSCAEKKPVLINVGRGSVIDEASILKSLEEGWISGAILDVFSTEPLPESSPLWNHPKVTSTFFGLLGIAPIVSHGPFAVTPHVSAVSLGPDIAELFANNLRLHLEGKKPNFIVDPARGY
jgi:glyoxylate/hydroxypyruvate reductase